MLKLLQESCCSLFLGQIIRMEVWMGLLVILSLVMEVIEASNLEWALNVCHITLWLCPPLLLMRGLRSRLERLLSIGNIYACSAEVILIPQGELLFLFWNGRIRIIKLLTLWELLFENGRIAELSVLVPLIIVGSGLRTLLACLICTETLTLRVLETRLIPGADCRLLNYCHLLLLLTIWHLLL
jgi:hypothetical protein